MRIIDREQMKKLIKNVLENLDQDNKVDPQFRQEYLKNEIRKFSSQKVLPEIKKLKELTWKIN